MRDHLLSAEQVRLDETEAHVRDWKLWGCYVSERAWGTVREDYSNDGSSWDYFPFEHSHLKAYRWNEDGIAGISDRKQHLCFALSFWNGRDPILKERFFGLSGNEGNHGEDVKEYYFYLDNTPTHSYMKFLYKYPQAEYPYEELKRVTRQRTKADPEYELLDTGIFEEDRYFDIFIEYAKADWDDIRIRVTAVNRGPEAAELHLLPTVWLRNTWTWATEKPAGEFAVADDSPCAIDVSTAKTGPYRLTCEDGAEFLFCDNETNFEKLYGGSNPTVYSKDGINDHVVSGDRTAVNPAKTGT